MNLLFSLSWFVLAISAVCGYGAVLSGVLLGPSLVRLDPVEAAAVARITYRLGARGAESACFLVGPAAVAVLVTAPTGPTGYGPWPWVAMALWAVTLVVRAAVVLPARRTVAVVLAELAGAPVTSETRTAQLRATAGRLRTGSLVVAGLFLVACAVVCLGVGAGG